MEDHAMKNAQRIITVGSLTHESAGGRFLLCVECGNESSANKGDYFMLRDSDVFTCCGQPIRRVQRSIHYQDA
jgi:hypothetical protein